MELPGPMYRRAILGGLLAGQRLAAMHGRRQNVGRAVGKPEAGTREGHLHHGSREIAGRVQHVLIRRGDPQAGGVIISSEVRGHEAPAGCGDQLRQHQDRLRGLHHYLHANFAEALQLIR